MQLFVGTYTRRTGSDGIYVLDFDPAAGTLTEPRLVAVTDNPSWLVCGADRLLACNEHADTEGAGEISVFARKGEILNEIQRVASHGADPCHLALATDRLAVANYSGGTVGLFEWTDGAIGALITVLKPTRTGPHPRQRTPHPHGVYFLNGELWVTDLGGDCVYRYDARTGEPTGRIDVPPGTGPRHLSRDGAYLVNELANTVLPISRAGCGEPVATLPADYASSSSTAEIQLHAGRLYVSNRGHDSITVLRTAPRLEVIQQRHCGGRHPRHFLIPADGRHLLVANRDTDNLVAITLDAEGRLGHTVAEVSCPSPVHLAPA